MRLRKPDYCRCVLTHRAGHPLGQRHHPLLGSDDFPVAAKREAASALTTAVRDGALSIPIGEPLPLDRMAEAHDRVDAGTRERVLLSLP